MSEKLPRYYQLDERDPWGNTLIRGEWPVQLWRTQAGNHVVWLWTDEFDGLHCMRKDRAAADAVFNAARDMLG